jgi:DNA-directed RNA polymerase specialized sigma24 family protein
MKVPIDGLHPSYTMDLASLEIERLLDKCPRKDRNLLEQTLAGYSAEEIARGAGITSTGIRVRLLRIRQALKQTTRVKQAQPSAAAA